MQNTTPPTIEDLNLRMKANKKKIYQLEQAQELLNKRKNLKKTSSKLIEKNKKEIADRIKTNQTQLNPLYAEQKTLQNQITEIEKQLNTLNPTSQSQTTITTTTTFQEDTQMLTTPNQQDQQTLEAYMQDANQSHIKHLEQTLALINISLDNRKAMIQKFDDIKQRAAKYPHYEVNKTTIQSAIDKNAQQIKFYEGQIQFFKGMITAERELQNDWQKLDKSATLEILASTSAQSKQTNDRTTLSALSSQNSLILNSNEISETESQFSGISQNGQDKASKTLSQQEITKINQNIQAQAQAQNVQTTTNDVGELFDQAKSKRERSQTIPNTTLPKTKLKSLNTVNDGKQDQAMTQGRTQETLEPTQATSIESQNIAQAQIIIENPVQENPVQETQQALTSESVAVASSALKTQAQDQQGENSEPQISTNAALSITQTEQKELDEKFKNLTQQRIEQNLAGNKVNESLNAFMSQQRFPASAHASASQQDVSNLKEFINLKTLNKGLKKLHESPQGKISQDIHGKFSLENQSFFTLTPQSKSDKQASLPTLAEISSSLESIVAQIEQTKYKLTIFNFTDQSLEPYNKSLTDLNNKIQEFNTLAEPYNIKLTTYQALAQNTSMLTTIGTGSLETIFNTFKQCIENIKETFGKAQEYEVNPDKIPEQIKTAVEAEKEKLENLLKAIDDKTANKKDKRTKTQEKIAVINRQIHDINQSVSDTSFDNFLKDVVKNNLPDANDKPEDKQQKVDNIKKGMINEFFKDITEPQIKELDGKLYVIGTTKEKVQEFLNHLLSRPEKRAQKELEQCEKEIAQCEKQSEDLNNSAIGSSLEDMQHRMKILETLPQLYERREELSRKIYTDAELTKKIANLKEEQNLKSDALLGFEAIQEQRLAEKEKILSALPELKILGYEEAMKIIGQERHKILDQEELPITALLSKDGDKIITDLQKLSALQSASPQNKDTNAKEQEKSNIDIQQLSNIHIKCLRASIGACKYFNVPTTKLNIKLDKAVVKEGSRRIMTQVAQAKLKELKQELKVKKAFGSTIQKVAKTKQNEEISFWTTRENSAKNSGEDIKKTKQTVKAFAENDEKLINTIISDLDKAFGTSKDVNKIPIDISDKGNIEIVAKSIAGTIVKEAGVQDKKFKVDHESKIAEQIKTALSDHYDTHNNGNTALSYSRINLLNKLIENKELIREINKPLIQAQYIAPSQNNARTI